MARYFVTRDTFVAPHFLKAGTEINYTGMPGDHLVPMDEEAEARMEEWYAQTLIEPDRVVDGVMVPGGKIFPNEKFRPLPAGEIFGAAQVQVVKEAAVDSGESLSLAEAQLERGRNDPIPPSAEPKAPAKETSSLKVADAAK